MACEKLWHNIYLFSFSLSCNSQLRMRRYFDVFNHVFMLEISSLLIEKRSTLYAPIHV